MSFDVRKKDESILQGGCKHLSALITNIYYWMCFSNLTIESFKGNKQRTVLDKRIISASKNSIKKMSLGTKSLKKERSVHRVRIAFVSTT